MDFLIRFRNYINDLEPSEFRRFIIILLLVISTGIGASLYYELSHIAAARQKIKGLNRTRQQAQDLFARHATVQEQQATIDEVLSQDKTFKIKEYFSLLTQENNMESALSRDPALSEPQDLKNGYNEIKLDASFTKITMEQLSKLLYELEKNKRIYTKELVINKDLKKPTIDATLVIATLQPKTS